MNQSIITVKKEMGTAQTQYAAPYHIPSTRHDTTRLSNANAKRLFGTGLVEGRFLEQSASVVDLDNVTVTREFSAAAHLHVYLTGVLGESPPCGFQNLLASGELELSSADGLHDVDLAGVLGSNRQQNLADIDTGGDTDGLSV